MISIPLRYEIYLANLNPTIGGEIKKIRPVVVVSQNEMNRYLETIVICPLTTYNYSSYMAFSPTSEL
ncbi:type II toxin-antitoxin system PemK/MazF family toxin [Candidatus Marithrix sp. Canyon 246]|uniref:type II toxin-antitoxin system PemK/MazF family toxin n=1 Tax=Candidatus Marithrix sp. Canyon 246 TaxID=1827136 RepID=UPI001C0C4F53|nr:type II toxin-antitoxin system PemK/MazF family toxin [Candidatus Marithrix sp. Canyon 246]